MNNYVKSAFGLFVFVLISACAATVATDQSSLNTQAVKSVEDQPVDTNETTAEATTEDAATTSETQAYDPNEIICKNQSQTGSRFKKRKCLSREKWALLERDGKEWLTNKTRPHGS